MIDISKTDHDLLSLMKEDSHAAFTEIYKRYSDVAYYSAKNILRDEHACLDVVQDIFTWLWNNRANLNVTALKPYILTAVRFKVLNVIKHGKFREDVVSILGKDEPSMCFTELAFEVKELKDIIDRFVGELPEQARKIFEMSRNQHLSHKQIATELGISENTVRKQIQLSLKKLRASLGKMSFWMTVLF